MGWALVVLQKTLESLWNCKYTNQSIPKETNAEYSLERLMLKMKLQYFGHLMWTANSLKKDSDILGKIEGKRRRERQRKRCLDSITNSMNMSLTWGRSWTWLNNWTAARHYSNCWAKEAKISFYCSQRVASNTIHQWKRTKILGEMADSRTRAGIIQDGLVWFCNARKQGSPQEEKRGGIVSKEYSHQPEGTPSGQSWSNLSNKIYHNSVGL